MDIRAILAGLAFALIWSSAFTSARVIRGGRAANFITVLTLFDFWPNRDCDCPYAGPNLAADIGHNGRPSSFLVFVKMLFTWGLTL